MKQLFLTSDAHSVAHDIPKYTDLSKGNKLVFIDTAAEPEKEEDITWLLNDRKSLVDAGFEVSDFTITDKNETQISTHLAEFDYIYCSGGDTAYLLNESYKSNFINIVKDLVENKGKIYIGTSAGSIIAGPSLPIYLKEGAYPETENNEAFNFVNFTAVPHWGSDFFKDLYLGKRLKQVYNENQVPFILLANHQYIYVKGDSFQIFNLDK